MTKITSKEDFRKWLHGKSKRVAVVFAARISLRILPFLNRALFYKERERSSSIILPCLRAHSAPWFAGTWPSQGAEFRAAANAAAVDAAAASASATPSASTTYASSASAADTIYAAATASYAAVDAAPADVAVDAAAHAAHAARAKLYIWKTIEEDIAFLDRANSLDDLMSRPLWPTEFPLVFEQEWQKLKTTLLGLDENWQVWTNWYEDRLVGGPRPNGRLVIEALERERVLIPDEDWKTGAAHVNAMIAEMEARHRALELPKQKPSIIEVELGDDGKIHRKDDDKEALDADQEEHMREAWGAHKDQFEDFKALDPARNEPGLRRMMERYETALGDDFDALKIIALGMQGKKLEAYAETASDRFLEDVQSEIKGLAAAHALFIRQFAKWRRYIENSEPDPSAEQLDEALAFAKQIDEFDDIIADDVLKPTQDIIEDIEEELFAHPDERPLLSKELLTVESNILSGLMRPCMDYVRDAAKAARKGSIGGIESGSANMIRRVIGIGGSALVLSTLMPDKFGWVKLVIDALIQALK